MGSCSGGLRFSTPIVSHTWNAVSCSAKKGLCCWNKDTDGMFDSELRKATRFSICGLTHGALVVKTVIGRCLLGLLFNVIFFFPETDQMQFPLNIH